MAKATNNMVLRGVRGRLGDIIVRQMRAGSIRLRAKRAYSNRTWSQRQKCPHERFKQATAYARQAARREPAYAALAQGTMKNAYNIALADWFHPPVIQCIERRGELILVEADDDVMVAKVRIKILDEGGQILEEGYAIQRDPELCPEWWEYVATTEGHTIAAEAWDLAGNRAELASS